MTGMGDITMASYGALLPEIYLGTASLLLLLYGVYRNPRANGALIFLAMLILGVTATCVYHCTGETRLVMNGMFISDYYSAFAKYLLLAATALTLLLAADWLREAGGKPFECIMLMLFATL